MRKHVGVFVLMLSISCVAFAQNPLCNCIQPEQEAGALLQG